jgi:hypothetical protein
MVVPVFSYMREGYIVTDCNVLYVLNYYLPRLLLLYHWHYRKSLFTRTGILVAMTTVEVSSMVVQFGRKYFFNFILQAETSGHGTLRYISGAFK